MPPKSAAEVLTIAAIRGSKGRRPTFLFNERERIFALGPSAKGAPAQARLLRQAFGSQSAVRVDFDERKGLIRKVTPVTPEQFAQCRERRPLLDRPEQGETIAVDEIDPTQFNIVDH